MSQTQPDASHGEPEEPESCDEPVAPGAHPTRSHPRPISTLHCPFPSALHPQTASTHEQTLRWLQQHGLLDPLDRSSRLATERYTWLVGRMFPTAGGAVLQLISDLTSWMFHHDDLCDEGHLRADPHAMAARFSLELALWSGQAHPVLPHELALWDLRQRVDHAAPDEAWRQQFAASLRAYFDGCLWEAHNRSAQRTPPLQEYISLRPFAGAVWMYLDLVELVMGRRLPFVLRHHREVRRLRTCVSNVVSWHNDLYSLPKEQRAGDPHNLVLVLQQEEGHGLAEATARVVARSNEAIQRFEQATATELGLPDALDDQLSAYVHALRLFTRGALDWAQEAQRYLDGPERR